MSLRVTEKFNILYQDSTPDEQKAAEKVLLDYLNKFSEFAKEKKSKQAVEFYHEEADKLVKELIIDRGVTGDCRAGCNFCCHMAVGVTHLEMYEVITYCTQKNIFPDNKLLLKQLSILADPSGKPLGVSPEEWMKQPREVRRCVFLQDGLCSIYPVRPMHCRAYFISTETKNSCEEGERSNAVVATSHHLWIEALWSAFLNVVGFVEMPLPLMLQNVCMQVVSTPVPVPSGAPDASDASDASGLIVPPTGIIT